MALREKNSVAPVHKEQSVVLPQIERLKLADLLSIDKFVSLVTKVFVVSNNFCIYHNVEWLTPVDIPILSPHSSLVDTPHISKLPPVSDVIITSSPYEVDSHFFLVALLNVQDFTVFDGAVPELLDDIITLFLQVDVSMNCTQHGINGPEKFGSPFTEFILTISHTLKYFLILIVS